MSGGIVTIGVQDVMFGHPSGAEFVRGQNFKHTPSDEAGGRGGLDRPRKAGGRSRFAFAGGASRSVGDR